MVILRIMKRAGCVMVALVASIVLLCLAQTSTALVVGIDLGSDSFKIVMVRPGSIDIVLNEGSGRKTASAIGYSAHGRMFGELAQQLVRSEFLISAESALVSCHVCASSHTDPFLI